MNRFLFILFVSFIATAGKAQNPGKPFIRLTDPLKEQNTVNTSRRFIVGSTCSTCSLTIKGESVKVYPTGAFAYECRLDSGKNEYLLQATSANSKPVTKRITYTFLPPVPENEVAVPGIERIQTYPEGDLILRPGERIGFRVKAYPGSSLLVFDRISLYELPDSITGGLKGIYQGEYVIRETDTFANRKISVGLISPDGQRIFRESTGTLTVMNDTMPDVAITRGRLAHLEYGLGDDRLGGAKVGYIDSLIRLSIIGKVGTHWKVRLAPSRTAYIPEEHVTLMPKGILRPASLTGKIKAYGDSLFDYTEVQLFNRLPYQSFQLTDPSRIVVDIFGATGNTNWIDQLSNLKEIKQVDYEQVSDDIFRVTIQLKHRQHWGHRIYYRDNNLIIQIKPQPTNLSLNQLTIAVDAGHGGTNTGAGGPTGVSEKELTLAVSLKLKKALEQEGAKVIMTREKEMFFDNKERILFYRDSTPDILLSIHLNSSADPINSGGTSTFYRYIGFRPLSQSIYKRMLELGLRDYGNNGSFNFMLNSPTEYPNALVEMLFLSNPAEEMLILDEGFQQQAVQKILEGINDFLQECKQP